ncbi:MAG TPA: capsular polysaccharide biosynthesis protein, partial [Epsilonproteobacteria bacterium]|nr:capsular polysaccharide biosynthesis protein [Campylobacterota bacterium]
LRGKCRIIDDDINPLSLLPYFEKVYTKTSQMGFEALLLGKVCICFGLPFYAGWGVTDDWVACERRRRKLSVEEIFAAAYIRYSRYFDRYSQEESDIFGVIDTIAKYRERDKKVNAKVFLFGFSLWKHRFIKPFIRQYRSIYFINPLPGQSALDLAIHRGLNTESRVFIWGKKKFGEVERYAKEKNIPIYRVEDGFIRSVGLGSDLTQPYSLVIDSRGIYFDPTRESDLEYLLNFHSFSDDEIVRAKKIRKQIIREKFSKYNSFEERELKVPKDKKIILVPGQVEDDASIQYGAPGMTNLKLLQKARKRAPEAYILYKPHPDVLAGNRVGQVGLDEAMAYCDRIIEGLSIDSVLAVCDEVHTMTSLVGFEAILRDIEVYTYGLPFYAGWGLSIDSRQCDRRKRALSADQLAAGVLLLYPRYIDPITEVLCEPELTLKGLKLIRNKRASSFFYRKQREWQNQISRKVQRLIGKLQKNSI